MAFLFSSANNEDCSICLTTINNKQKHQLKCTHQFHTNCINEWLKNSNSCPICRCVIIKKCEPSIKINMTTNHIYLPPSPQRNKKNCIVKYYDKIKNNIYNILFLLFSLGYLGSCIYHMYEMKITSNYINSFIKNLNDTQLGDHNHNTFSSEVFICYNILYIVLFIISKYNLLTKETFNNYKPCCNKGCSGIFLVILYLSNFIIQFSFITNLNTYLNDKTIDFDQLYYNNINKSLLIFGIIYGFKIFFGLIAVYKSM